MRCRSRGLDAAGIEGLLAQLLGCATVSEGVRSAIRCAVVIALGCGLLVVGVGTAAAARLHPSWRYVGASGEVLTSPRYVFMANPGYPSGLSKPGGTLIDEQTGSKKSIVPPSPAGYDCPSASAIGGPWLAFGCVAQDPTSGANAYEFALYRIATGRWRVVPDVISGNVLGVGADWIEIWAADAGEPQPRLVFQNLITGKTQTLAAWQPGGDTVPDLNSPALGRRLCAPVRVPNAWQAIGENTEDWPGTLSFFGAYAVAWGYTRALKPFGYLERCGTHLHRWIGPIGGGVDYAAANAHAVVWQQSNLASDLQGAYLPSLKKFTIDTTDLVNSVPTEYTGESNTYSSWLTSRALYVLVQPGYPTSCTPDPCYPDPSQLYETPAPRQPQHRKRR